MQIESTNIINFTFILQVIFVVMKEIKKRSSCPISSYLDIWGDKWSLLIIRDLMILKQCTYGDFLKSDEKIATNILASRLLMLEENDIIKKAAHPESKAKFLYTLTEKGIDILPIIVEISIWSDKYIDLPIERKKLIDEIKKGKEDYVKKSIKNLKKINT